MGRNIVAYHYSQKGWAPPTYAKGAQKEGENRVFPDFLYRVLFLLEKDVPEKYPGVLQDTNPAFLNWSIFSAVTGNPKK